MGAYDGYQYAKKKNLKGWKKGAAIVGGALLGAVNPFKIVGKVGKVAKAVKAVKTAKKAKKTTKALKAVTKTPKKTVVTKKVTKVATAGNKTVKTTRVIKAQSKTVKGACFVAGTKVSTEKGFMPIEKIKPGDYVWSENPETNEKALKKVNKIFVREKDSIVRLSINGEIIETTDEHPFYVEGKGFVGAGALNYGDEVRLQSGDTSIVDDIDIVQLDEPIEVYNFEVEDFHTYYVSEQEVLVHNMCATSNANSTSTAAKSIGNNVEDPEFDKWLNKGSSDTTVYFGMEGKHATYVGITKQPLGKRLQQHNSSSNKLQKNFSELKEKYTGLTRNQARAIEQYYLELAMGPNMRNRINSISSKNKYHDQAISWAKNYIEGH